MGLPKRWLIMTSNKWRDRSERRPSNLFSPRQEDPDKGASVEETRLPIARSSSFIPQVSLVTLFLAIALIAVWLAWWQTGQSIERLERQMPGLRSVARELFVDDPSNVRRG